MISLSLSKCLSIKSENDAYFIEKNFPNMKSEYFANYIPVKKERHMYTLSDNILPMTTTECIIANKGKKIIALNFANAMHAGGAYIMGGNAQEEALCRSSMLYYTIKNCKEFYSANRKHVFPDYTDGMIYSENVPVIRDDFGNMLEAVMCDFITCPAVNRTIAKITMSDKKINAVMEQRIKKIVSLTNEKKPDVIIFGAFGCGAFGNKREIVYDLFEKAINSYTDGKAEIKFAVPV